MELTCPICLEESRRPNFPYECGHTVCHACTQKMDRENLYRCPICRAPREGMTAQQAAPRDTGTDTAPMALFPQTMFFAAQPSIPTLSADFAAAVLMVEDDRQARQPIDLSLLDEDIQMDIAGLQGVPMSIEQWQRRRRAQLQRRTEEYMETPHPEEGGHRRSV